ncbi:MAG: hypothetical protein P8Y23_03265 [Candidatus Lokiarchaeota archaeon]
MASQRKISKELIHFGQREYREKKPIQVKVLRIKDATIFKRGVFPSLVIKQSQTIQYVVVAEYIDISRVYLFNSKGILIGAENIEKESQVFERLTKASKKLYHIP